MTATFVHNDDWFSISGIPGASFTFTVTDHRDGLISGTFSGRMDKSNPTAGIYHGLVDISSGEFRNLPINYQ